MLAPTSYIMYTCNTYLSDICRSSGSLSSLLYFLLLLFSCRSDVLLRSLSLLCLRCLPRPSSLSRLQSLLRCLLCLSWSQSLSRDLSRLISLCLLLWSRLQSLSDRSDPQPLRGVRPGESSSLWLNSLPGLWYTCRKLQFLPRGHRFLSKRPAKNTKKVIRSNAYPGCLKCFFSRMQLNGLVSVKGWQIFGERLRSQVAKLQKTFPFLRRSL